MITDRLQNWRSYPLGAAWDKAFEFLLSLSPDIEDGEYPLQGEDIFARVMRYETRPPETAVLEAHRSYLDIQTVLLGEERLEWFAVEGLPVKESYDPARDAEFYARTGPGAVHVDLCPGLFAALFPQDAHMPCLMIGDKTGPVSKVVVKIKTDLLFPAWRG